MSVSKEDLFFLESARHGCLYYHNVYSVYDEPIIFTALNEFEQLFFCYSLGCDETHDRWLIVPVSQDRVNKLEQKDLPIIKMLKPSAKTKLTEVKIDLETFEISESLRVAKELPYQMPSDKVFIHENINYDGRRNYSHRIRVAKVKNSDIMSETLNKVSEVFVEFCRHYLRKHEIKISLYAKDAVRGSFVYRMKAVTKDEEQLKTEGYRLLSGISSRDDFLKSLEEREVDLRILRKLFDLIGSNDIEVQLVDEESTETILNLSPSYITEVLPAVDDLLGSYLDSTMVPQADNLNRIKLYLSIVANNQIVDDTLLGVDPRQVSYYKDACEILSLIHEYSSLTPLGLKVAQSQSDEEWLGIIKRQFEESECGNLWMLDQEVDSITKIDENSAVQFLIDNCNGLSEKTSKRRAQTLKAWVKTLKTAIG